MAGNERSDVLVCRHQGPGMMTLRDDRNQTHEVRVGAWVSAVRPVKDLGDRFRTPEIKPSDAERITGPFILCGESVSIYEDGETKVIHDGITNNPSSVPATLEMAYGFTPEEEEETSINSVDESPAILVASIGGEKEHLRSLLDAVPMSCPLSITYGNRRSESLLFGGAAITCKKEHAWKEILRQVPDSARWVVMAEDGVVPSDGAVIDAVALLDRTANAAIAVIQPHEAGEDENLKASGMVTAWPTSCIVGNVSILRSIIGVNDGDSSSLGMMGLLISVVRAGWRTIAASGKCLPHSDGIPDLISQVPWTEADTLAAAENLAARDKSSAVPVAVVVTVHNAMASTLRTLESLARNDFGGNLKPDVIVMDDCSADLVSNRLIEFCDKQGWTLRKNEKNLGYTGTINKGVDFAISRGAKWVCLLNSDTWCPRGWLWKMVRAGETDDKIGLVGPTSNNAVHGSIAVPGGFNPESIADELALVSRRLVPDVPTPTGFCLLVRCEAWEIHGPFDEDYYGDAYGEECGLWAELVQGGWRAVLADDAFVWHEGHASYGNEVAVAMEQQAVAAFLSRHGDLARSAFQEFKQRQPKEIGYLERRAGHRLRSARPKVCYVLNDWGLYGGVFAIAHVIDRLCRRGWDATVCVGMGVELKAIRALPIQVFPKIFNSQSAMVNRCGDELIRDGVVVASVWNTAQMVQRICEKNSGLRPCYFVQDDETYFTDTNGHLYTDPTNVHNSYKMIDTIIANSLWVKRCVEDNGGKDVRYIPVGVDNCTFRFRPELVDDKAKSILFFYRPETPRRGSSLVENVAKIIHAKNPKIAMSAFGGRGHGLPPNVEQLGRITQREVAMHYARNTVFLEASEKQGFGLQGLEAMASGCGLVSTKNLGIDNYGRDGENCVLVDYENPDQVAGAILGLLEDDERRKSQIELGKKTALKFDWDEIATQHAEVYAELLGIDPPGRWI